MAGPLDGIRVVELGVWVAGPAAGGLLADWGADVVKIEPPAGDPARGFAKMLGGDVPFNPPFEMDNRSKRSIVIDFARPGGIDLALELLDGADAFVTNIRLDALERLGLDPERVRARNPRLVYSIITGFGMAGDDRDRAAYDIGAFWARSGIASMLTPPDGQPPFQRGGMGDHGAGMTLAAGTCAALVARAQTGAGQLVHTSLLRHGMYTLSFDLNTALRFGVPLGVAKRTQMTNPAINCYQDSEQRWFWLIGLEGERHWPDLCRAVERPEWIDDERFATAEARRENIGELIGLLDAVFATRTRAQWGEALDREDMWWAPVQTTDEVLADPQAWAGGGFTEVPEDGSAVTMINSPLDYLGTRPVPGRCHRGWASTPTRSSPSWAATRPRRSDSGPTASWRDAGTRPAGALGNPGGPQDVDSPVTAPDPTRRPALRRLAGAALVCVVAAGFCTAPGLAAPAFATKAPATEAPAGSRATADPPDPYFPNLGNRGYDVTHYDVGLRFDTATKVAGDTRITATAGEELTRFNLDLADLDVASVTVDGRPARFRRTGNELVVRPAQPIASGDEFVVRVRYSGGPTPGEIPGIAAPNGWIPTDDGVITLNEPDGASRVFPANDHPTDKASYTFRLDVPKTQTAIANGTLQSRTEHGDRAVWVWEQDAPMASYLTQLAIGDLTMEDQPAVDGVTLRNAYGPQVRDKAAQAAQRTPEMLQFLSQWFGKFPFSSYGVLAPDQGPNGLAFEAQTFSLFAPDLFFDPEQASVVLAHELTHQWFGDWVSPASWDETWLNEGFATYGEWLWSDHALGVPLETNVQDALVHAQGNPGAAAANPGKDRMFDHAVYERGALAVHALRLTVGDEQFAEILRRYLAEYGGKAATTRDLVRVASDVAGRDLTDFFADWLGPGKVPELPETPTPVGSTPPATTPTPTP